MTAAKTTSRSALRDAHTHPRVRGQSVTCAVTIAVLCVSITLLVPATAAAQSTAQVGEQSDEALRADGWEFSEQGATPGSIPGGVLALVLGAPWHGVGHTIANDRDSARRLLATEGIALGIFAAGIITRTVGDQSATARTIGTTVAVSGGGMFAAGWLADVVGAFKGTALPLPRNSAEIRGATIEGYVTTLVESGLDLNAIGVVRVPVYAERWVMIPEIHLGFDAAYRRFGALAGWRAPFGANRISFLELSSSGLDEHVSQHGYGRTQFAGGATLNLNIGDILPHLNGLIWTHRIEVAVDHHYFASLGNQRFRRDGRQVHVPVETSVGFNANQGLYVEVGYQHRRDALIGMLGRNGDVGAFWGRVGFSPRNRLGIDLRVEQGAYTRAWFGLQWSLARRDRNVAAPTLAR